MVKRQIGLDYIPERKLNRLRERVERAGGKLIVIVHPFYREGTTKYFEKYEKAVEALLRKSSWPIVVLEEAGKIKNGSIQGRLRKLGAKSVFLIPTTSGSPSIQRRVENERPIIDSEMDSLPSQLEKVGAKDVYVAGMYAIRENEPVVRAYESMLFAKKKNGKSKFKYLEDPLAGGCAGYTYAKLIHSKKFRKVMWIPNAKIGFDSKIGKERPYTRPKKKSLLKRAVLRFRRK